MVKSVKNSQLNRAKRRYPLGTLVENKIILWHLKDCPLGLVRGVVVDYDIKHDGIYLVVLTDTGVSSWKSDGTIKSVQRLYSKIKF